MGMKLRKEAIDHLILDFPPVVVFILSGAKCRDENQSNPPALPACLVKWGLMTDCLSVLGFCLYSLS